MMTSAQVVKTSVNVNSNSTSQDYTHPDDHNLPNYDMTPGFKPFTIEDKIKEGQTQLDNRENYRPLVNPVVEETNLRVQQLISELYLGNLIDEMTKTWLCQIP